MEERKVPKLGEITVREIHVPVCLECGCVISDTGLCDESCDYDAKYPRPSETVECHVYKRTDEYVRKEEARTCPAILTE